MKLNAAIGVLLRPASETSSVRNNPVMLTGSGSRLYNSNQSLPPSKSLAIHSLTRRFVGKPSVAGAALVAPGVAAASKRHWLPLTPIGRSLTWKPYSTQFTGCPSGLKRYTPPLLPESEKPEFNGNSVVAARVPSHHTSR